MCCECLLLSVCLSVQTVADREKQLAQAEKARAIIEAKLHELSQQTAHSADQVTRAKVKPKHKRMRVRTVRAYAYAYAYTCACACVRYSQLVCIEFYFWI